MSKFEQALINAEVAEQETKKVKAAKKAYVADLVAQGVDKMIAKIMADTFFENGMVKAI